MRPASRSTDLDLLRSAPFVGALALLVVNDHVLKPAFHNAVTGKLSDVAGLFALALFCRALAPARRTAVCLTIAALWVWWKLPLSQLALDAWNALGVFPLGRVVDPTDLLALVVLPAAWSYAPRARADRPALRGRMATLAMCAASVLAFAATSRAPRLAPELSQSVSLDAEPEHELAMSKREFVRRLQLTFSMDFMDRSFAGRFREPEPDSLTITVPSPGRGCTSARLQIEVRETLGRAVVRPLRVESDCTSRLTARDAGRRTFDEWVIRRMLQWKRPDYGLGRDLPAPVDVDP